MEDNEFEEVTIISHTPVDIVNSHVEIVALKRIKNISLQVTQKPQMTGDLYMLHYRSPLYELEWRNHVLHFNLNEPVVIYGENEETRITYYYFVGQPGWHVHRTAERIYFKSVKQQIVSLDYNWGEKVIIAEAVADFSVDPDSEEIVALYGSGRIHRSDGTSLQIVCPPTSEFDIMKKCYGANLIVTQYDDETYRSTMYLVRYSSLILLADLQLSTNSRAKPGQLRLLAPKGGTELVLAKRGGTLMLFWIRKDKIGLATEISVGLHIGGLVYQESAWNCWIGGKNLGCKQVKIRF
jgi:hypothetical protein